MRLQCALISVLLLTACGGRSINKNMTRDLIMGLPEEHLEEKDIEILNLTQVSGSEAIAETRLRTAFRLEKVRGMWVVREVRLGQGQWEKVSNLLQTLEKVKTEETGAMLDRIAEAILRYRKENLNLPVFVDYIGLSDLLSPKYLSPLIRLDAWRRPLAAERTGSGEILLRSAGPDGQFGTDDDIRRNVP